MGVGVGDGVGVGVGSGAAPQLLSTMDTPELATARSADQASSLVRRFDANTSAITTVAGTGVHGFSGDGGLAAAATLNISVGSEIATDASGNVLLADSGNHRIREI